MHWGSGLSQSSPMVPSLIMCELADLIEERVGSAEGLGPALQLAAWWSDCLTDQTGRLCTRGSGRNLGWSVVRGRASGRSWREGGGASFGVRTDELYYS